MTQPSSDWTAQTEAEAQAQAQAQGLDPIRREARQILAPKTREQLRQILMAETGIPVSADDPVLLVYAIHRVSLEEQTAIMATLLAEAREVLDASTTKAAADLAATLKGQMAALKEQIASDTLRERLTAMQETAVLANQAVTGMQRQVRWGAAISSLTILAAGVALAVLGVTLS